MKGKNATAQELTIQLLAMLDSLDRRGVAGQAARYLSGQEDALGQLNLCDMMAGELKKEPDKYKDFFLLAKTIVARQKHTSPGDITKKMVGEVMKMNPTSAGNLLDRIADHIREPKQEEIHELLNGFEDSSNRLFWKNQIYLCFPDLLRSPDITEEDAEGKPVLECLRAVWNSLSQPEQAFAADRFPSHAGWFRQLEGVQKSDVPQSGLYDFLDQARKRANVTLTDIYEKLSIHEDTYAAYKKNWIEFEKNGCSGAYPAKRLSRQRLLYLAVYLEMDFYAAAGMLATAGYDFHSSKGDILAAGYLLDRRYPKQEALKRLHPQS